MRQQRGHDGSLCFWKISFALIAALVSCEAFAAGPFRLTVIQTADMHSHFTNHNSDLGRGGLARVVSVINNIRGTHENTLLLDAGDWSEGTMFFTIDTGETTQRLLSAMNYDAMVLGNHDWLIGPKELYNTFERTQFATPVLSANLDFHNLDPRIKLGKYIKPYVIKQFGNVRVGIFGLSTFELIYDSYFGPVGLVEPVGVAARMVEKLRIEEGCDIVIALSHLGFSQDKWIGKLVKGIDYIVGGHTHILLKQPYYSGGTPITHVGTWGQYVGQTDLVFENGKTKIENFAIHVVDEKITEEPLMKDLVDGAIVKMEQKFGPVLSDNIIKSEVDLPAQRASGENTLGNWAVDAIREAGQAELAVDSPNFASRDLYKGYFQTADFFDAFPHIYNPLDDKAWTIKTFELNGFIIKSLMAVIDKIGFAANWSNAQVVLDYTNKRKIKSLLVGGQPINYFRNYKIAATDGIWKAILFFEKHGIDLGPSAYHDTGLEAWPVIMQAVKARSPITPDKIKWEGRVRTLQPDLEIRGEEVSVTRTGPVTADLAVTVRNTGLSPAPASVITAKPGLAPNNASFFTQAFVPALTPAQDTVVHLVVDTSTFDTLKTPVLLEVKPVDREGEKQNNTLEIAVDSN